jgi:hypothetical protein
MLHKNENLEANFDGMNAAFVEPKINDEASQYIATHFEEIRIQTRKMGVNVDFIDDLIADVWQSIRVAELEGNGYDISHSNEGDVITVEEFVYGRIKRYSLNGKYKADFVEKKVSKDSTKCIQIVSACNTEGKELDKLDGFQKAYELAASYDDVEAVEAEMSLRSNIEFCMGFDKEIGFSILNLFKNIEMFSKVGFNSSIFDKLKEACNYHTEFGEAFKDIMLTAQNCRPIFDSVVESF